jgi:putative ABC transport system permease protein
MGFPHPDSAIGRQVNYWDVIYTIIGVMEDYHQQSPKAAFEPHIYRFLPYGRGVRGMFAFKLNTQESNTTVNIIQKNFDQFFPGNSFEYFFLDDYFNAQYKDDMIIGKVFGLFALLAVFITALGIYGLYSFLMLQRTKEICIRNIMGANISRILFLFGREFFLLIIIAFVISWVLCSAGIHWWLNSFASKMPVTVWLFVLPLLLMMVVAGITIGSQVLKVARANPAGNLRYE